MQLIEKLPEPKRLLLAWQSSRPGASRRRWDIGELRRTTVDADAPVSFTYHADEELVGAMNLGFEDYPAFRRKLKTFRDTLETFTKRLPPRRRADFGRYLETLRISPAARFTDFALLAASEAKLPSDGFSIVNPWDETDGAFQFMMEAVGYRHLEGRPSPRVGAAAALVPEPTNEHDPNAIQVTVEGQPVGWVNRLQTNAFRTWMAADRITLTVERLNGTLDHPRIHLMAHVRA